jgi:hypothetical protein
MTLNENINTDEILKKLNLFEDISLEYRNLKEKINKEEAIIDSYKSSIKFLIENQNFKDNIFKVFMPSNLFLNIERKKAVPFIQKLILNKTENLNNNKSELNKIKKKLLSNIKIINDIQYLENDIYDDFQELIKKKFPKEFNINENSSDSD